MVAVVPLGWTNMTEEDCEELDVAKRWTCRWPKYNSQRISKAVMREESPMETWETFDIRVLYKTRYFSKAQEKLNDAELHSDLQTDAEEQSQKRRKRANKKYAPVSSDSDSSEEGPSPGELSKENLPPVPARQALPTPPSLPRLLTQNASRRILSSPSHNLPAMPAPVTRPIPALTTPPRRPVCQQTTPSTPVMSSPTATSTAGCTPTEIHIIKLLAELNEKIDHNTRLLNRITEFHQLRAGRDTPFTFPLPLTDFTALDELEERLRTESTLKKHMVSTLSAIGGCDVADTTRRIMKKTISTDLARQLNWMGKGQKRSFSALTLRAVVCDAVRKNPLSTTASDSDIESTIKNWLKYAGDRDGGRKMRRNQTD